MDTVWYFIIAGFLFAMAIIWSYLNKKFTKISKREWETAKLEWEEFVRKSQWKDFGE